MADRLAGNGGGITGLIALIDEHQAAFDYDWRTRFHMPASVIGDSMPWDEAVRLARILRADPTSMLAASIEGWDHAISREALVLMDLFDLEHAVNSKKPPKPHPGRPWKDKRRRQHMGNVAGRTPSQVRSLLAKARAGLLSEEDR